MPSHIEKRQHTKPTILTAPIVLAVLALALCAFAAAPAPPEAGARTFDLQHSTMTVYVYKQGIFAFAADNHEVEAPIEAGSYDSEKHNVELSVDAAKLRVLDRKMPTQRRATVQSNMAGPMVLDAAKYPTITFRSTKIAPAARGHWTVTGELALHGRTHSIAVDVLNDRAQHFAGSAMVRQSEFGITPIRIAGGTVKVKDDVKVVFDISLK